MTAAPAQLDVRVRSPKLISLDEACQRAASYVTAIDRCDRVFLVDALDRVLAEQVCALVALPPFDQSAMDGYAFAASSINRIATEITIVSRVAAGTNSATVPAGAAARIFTGAPIPPGADTVVMQEHVRREGLRVTIDGPVRAGSNIRRCGEDIAKGETLLEVGQRLDALHLALLAAQGISSVGVFHRPRIVIVSTGDELRQPGQLLGEASIYDSNRPMLLALASRAGLDAVDGGFIPDNAEVMADRLSALADGADMIVTTGGASTGEEDHAAAALAANKASFEILSIALKPGKPAIVGRFGNSAYLGLPGNPVSALVAWLTVGSAMVAALCGRKPHRRLGCSMTTISAFERKPGRTEFVPGRLVSTEAGPCVEILGRGGSARLKPLIHADGLAEIEATAGNISPGDSVVFHAFRSGFAT
jgi:molybdopterin molybdotransferase